MYNNKHKASKGVMKIKVDSIEYEVGNRVEIAIHNWGLNVVYGVPKGATGTILKVDDVGVNNQSMHIKFDKTHEGSLITKELYLHQDVIRRINE